MKTNPAWYDIKTPQGSRPQVYIFGVIVDYKWDAEDVTAREFVDAIKDLDDFDLRINSPGGSVVAGIAIYNALRRHKGGVDVYVEGIAASMASVIAMAGKRLIMPANAMLMIHDPWSYAVGTAEDLRKSADTLDKCKTNLVAAYHDKSGQPRETIEQMMSDETWITAEEAVALGFADEIEQPLQMAAHFDLSRYKHAPQALAVALPKKEEKPPMNIESLKTDHPEIVDAIRTEARAGMIDKTEADAVAATAAAAESGRILALASATLGEDLGKKLETIVAAGLTAEQVQALGVTFTAETSAIEQQMLAAITAAAAAGVRPAQGASNPEKTGIDTAAIYARRRQAVAG